jgi:hypothetical protein
MELFMELSAFVTIANSVLFLSSRARVGRDPEN